MNNRNIDNLPLEFLYQLSRKKKKLLSLDVVTIIRVQTANEIHYYMPGPGRRRRRRCC